MKVRRDEPTLETEACIGRVMSFKPFKFQVSNFFVDGIMGKILTYDALVASGDETRVGRPSKICNEGS